MVIYQNTMKRMDNYKDDSKARIKLSTVIICTKFLDTQISQVGSPTKLNMI